MRKESRTPKLETWLHARNKQKRKIRKEKKFRLTPEQRHDRMKFLSQDRINTDKKFTESYHKNPP